MFVGHSGSLEFWIASEQKALEPILDCASITEVVAGTMGCIQHYPNQILGTYKHTVRKWFDYDGLLSPPLRLDSSAEITIDLAASNIRSLFEKNLTLKSHPEREQGYLLSGGLDSSLTCGVSAKILAPHRIRTFTGGFHEDASDIQAARKVAKHINSIHTEYGQIFISPRAF